MWKRITADEYVAIDSHLCVRLQASYGELASKLGEPHRSGEADFPDDDRKVDVCWGFRKGGDVVAIWNYKNGPAYIKGATLNAINSFSVFHTSPETWADFKAERQVGLAAIVRKAEEVERDTAVLRKTQPKGVKIGEMDV